MLIPADLNLLTVALCVFVCDGRVCCAVPAQSFLEAVVPTHLMCCAGGQARLHSCYSAKIGMRLLEYTDWERT